MALNIKNAEVERLATELAAREGVSKTEVIRLALEARRKSAVDRSAAVLWLETQVWPSLPPAARRPLSKKQKEKILGYGTLGV